MKHYVIEKTYIIEMLSADESSLILAQLSRSGVDQRVNGHWLELLLYSIALQDPIYLTPPGVLCRMSIRLLCELIHLHICMYEGIVLECTLILH